MDITSFWTTVNNVCEIYHGSITSGHRTEKHNTNVGGAPLSHHLGWKAADILWDDDKDRQDAEDVLRANGLWVEVAKNALAHTHVDDRQEPPA